MQEELHKEFNSLIKEISKEVLDLSVSKSMEKASYTVQEQVPAMAGQIKQLTKIVRDLQAVNAEVKQYQQLRNKKDSELELKFQNLLIKLENNEKSIKEARQVITTLQKETQQTLDTQENTIHRLSNDQKAKIDNRFNELSTVTNDGVATGLTTKKLLIWTLILSGGSFGTILLDVFGIISL